MSACLPVTRWGTVCTGEQSCSGLCEGRRRAYVCSWPITEWCGHNYPMWILFHGYWHTLYDSQTCTKCLIYTRYWFQSSIQLIPIKQPASLSWFCSFTGQSHALSLMRPVSISLPVFVYINSTSKSFVIVWITLQCAAIDNLWCIYQCSMFLCTGAFLHQQRKDCQKAA